MAARVTDTEVKAIIATGLDTTAFITTANILVNTHLSSSGLANDLLTQIELYLSAHFVGMRQRQKTQEKIGESQDSFGGQFGLGLDFTQYGQTVKLLDSTGILGSLNQAQKTTTLDVLQ